MRLIVLQTLLYVDDIVLKAGIPEKLQQAVVA